MGQKRIRLEKKKSRRLAVDSRFLTRVALRNYRSIGGCDVELGPLTFLVGPNGAGKSNFLDALRLITDSLRTSLDHALRDRGGIHEVRRRSAGHPTHFGIRVDFRLKKHKGSFAFEVGARRGRGFEIREERCTLGPAAYVVRSGVVERITSAVAPPAASDRLYLVTAAGLPEFRPVYDALSHMGFYNLNPDQIRALQPPDEGDVLARDGRNLPSVLERLAKGGNGAARSKRRVEEYLARVVPGIEGVDTKRVGHMETVEFRQRIESQQDPWRFPAINMSDGTLRALGTLVSLFQRPLSTPVPLVGIEEPEVALHPAAAGILLDSLRDASRRTQVIVTSHSPDLLDSSTIQSEEILAVTSIDGRTEIGPIDTAGRDALIRRLYTAGELLRVDHLRPDPEHVRRVANRQLPLFGEDVEE